MRPLLPLDTLTALATNVTALAVPPSTSYGFVADSWTTADGQVVPEFALEMWADGAASLTGVELFGAHVHPLTVADLTVTASTATNKLTHNGHGLLTGDGPLRIASTLTLPGGLEADTDYWAIKSDANTFYLATSLANALSGSAIDLITTNGTGVITVSDTADTERVHWHSHGLLGPLEDGAVELTDQLSYLTYRRHYPRAVAYALASDVWSGGHVWAGILPVKEVG